MKATFDKVFVTEVFTSEGSGIQYGTFQSEEGTFKLSSPEGGFDLAGLPRLEPIRVQCNLRGHIFQGSGQSLEVVAMTVQLLSDKKSA